MISYWIHGLSQSQKWVNVAHNLRGEAHPQKIFKLKTSFYQVQWMPAPGGKHIAPYSQTCGSRINPVILKSSSLTGTGYHPETQKDVASFAARAPEPS